MSISIWYIIILIVIRDLSIFKLIIFFLKIWLKVMFELLFLINSLRVKCNRIICRLFCGDPKSWKISINIHIICQINHKLRLFPCRILLFLKSMSRHLMTAEFANVIIENIIHKLISFFVFHLRRLIRIFYFFLAFGTLNFFLFETHW